MTGTRPPAALLTALPAAILVASALTGCMTALSCPSCPPCQALPAYQAAPPLDTSAAAYYAMGRSLQAARRDAEAVKAYKHALQIDPHHADASNGIAVVYALHGHHALAIGMLRELVARAGEKDASQAYLLNNLGYAYLLDSQYGPAVTTLEKAVALTPDDLGMLRNLGQALNRASQP